MPTGQPDQPAHETSPAEFLDADQDAYREAAVRARQVAIETDDTRRAYAEQRRQRRGWRARLLRVGR